MTGAERVRLSAAKAEDLLASSLDHRHLRDVLRWEGENAPTGAGSATEDLDRILNRVKARVSSRVKHVFAVVKRLWGSTRPALVRVHPKWRANMREQSYKKLQGEA